MLLTHAEMFEQTVEAAPAKEKETNNQPEGRKDE